MTRNSPDDTFSTMVKGNLWIRCCFLFVFVVFHPLPLSAQGFYPSAEIDLSHWAIENPSEIRYLLIGILHKEKGDELVVHDVRREKPVIAEPSVPKSRIPAFDDGVFILDDFQGKNTNRLGGYFNAFSIPPSKSGVAIDHMEDGRYELRFSYRIIEIFRI